MKTTTPTDRSKNETAEKVHAGDGAEERRLRSAGKTDAPAGNQFRPYRRTAIAEMADWTPESDMVGVSVSPADRAAGSPKPGDKIARNPKNNEDRWLVAAAYFAEHFEPMEGSL